MRAGFQSRVTFGAIIVGTLTLASAAMAQAPTEFSAAGHPPVDPAVVTLPSWITPPAPILRALPAGKYIRDGRVELTCTSQPTGEVTDCAVTYEIWQDRDLGLADLLLAAIPASRMSPRTVDGAPEASVVRFVARYGSGRQTILVGAPVGPAPLGEMRLLERPDWGRVPPVEYPERAMAQNITSGQVTLNCGLLSSGDLVHCQIVAEMPAAAGFGAAALAGARRGRVSDGTAQAAPLGTRAQFTLHFLVN